MKKKHTYKLGLRAWIYVFSMQNLSQELFDVR